MNQTWIFRGALSSSVLVHAVLLTVSPAPARVDERPAPTEMVMFTVPEPPEPELPPVVEPELEEPPPEPEVVPEPEAEPEPVETSEPTPSEPTEAEPPAELTGTTLLAEGPGDFTAEEGSGRDRRGAVRAGESRAIDNPPPKIAPKIAPPKPAPPQAVPLAQLSRRPVPPALGARLRENYPASERQQGKSGEAKVRAMIDPSGNITVVQVAEESGAAFGSACRKTLLGSQWSAPLDAKGKPVPTWITYRCKFRIDD